MLFIKQKQVPVNLTSVYVGFGNNVKRQVSVNILICLNLTDNVGTIDCE